MFITHELRFQKNFRGSWRPKHNFNNSPRANNFQNSFSVSTFSKECILKASWLQWRLYT